MRTKTVIAMAVTASLITACSNGSAAGGGTTSKAAVSQAAIDAAVAAPTRSATNLPRDQYRHPAQTLGFFGVEPGDTIVELWPGAGWYTEILAPFSNAGGGTLYAAGPWTRLKTVQDWQAAKPDIYGKVQLAEFPNSGANPKVPDGSADVVLTFRNVHNWRFGGKDNTAAAFRQIYAMLKPGGTLGVVDHRLDEGDDSAKEEKSGYMKTSSVVGFAEAAGFKLVATSEINANPRDTKDYPQGVWTLPPNLREGDKDREKYLAIGESDRMTLKFVKPAG